MRKILITGASGFIGSFLIEEAIRKGWQTWAGVRNSSNREYLTDVHIQFVDLNYSDLNRLKQQINEQVVAHGRWDYIIHNAGITKCIDVADFERINYSFTCNLIEALIEAKAIPEKFILMSSLSAFPNPDSAYGKSKLRAEQFLQSQTNFPYIILRPTGVYGPRDKDYLLLIRTIEAGFEVTAGLKPQLLTFIYVKDLVKATFLALELSIYNQAYAVADGDVYTDEAFTKIIKNVLGRKYIFKIKIPLPILKIISAIIEEFSKMTSTPSTLNRDKFKIMKQRDWTCDVLPLQNDLNFQADYSLKRGIAETVEWYRSLNANKIPKRS